MELKRTKTYVPWVEQVLRKDSVVNYRRSGEWSLFVALDKPEIVEVLADLGGQPVGSYWHFDHKPTDDLHDGYYELRRWSYYPSPEGVAKRLVQIADIQSGDRVLEPSAGTGHLASHLVGHGHGLEVNEYHYLRRQELAERFLVVENPGDFLKFQNGLGAITWDVIVQNPPYLDWQWIDHVIQAYKLAPRSVSLLSARTFELEHPIGNVFRWWLDGKNAEIVPLGSHKFVDGESETDEIPLLALVLNRARLPAQAFSL